VANAVLTTKVSPSYDDQPESYYHFPKSYLNQIEAAIGDWIVYYEPRRSSTDRASTGGRSSYFALARVTGVTPDRLKPDHFYAQIADYLDFDSVVPFSIGPKYFESGLRKSDGSTNKGAFGRSVRPVPQFEFEEILTAGFSNYIDSNINPREPWLTPAERAYQFAEPDLTFIRPMVEVTSLRPFRERQFKIKVREAYDSRCAVTGLRLLNGGGRPEVEAAHIIAVQDNGPDSVRNGLALSGTVHWLFDRGLISVDQEYRLLAVNNSIPDALRPLVTPGKPILLPNEQHLWPHQSFLEHHRANRFKG
jgi:putative restriction endonuclease